MTPRLRDAYPATARTRPGEQVALRLELDNPGPALCGTLRARLLDNGVEVARAEAEVEVSSGCSLLELPVTVPMEDARGYEALLELELPDGARVAARTAVLVVSHWRLAPRYGFLSEFAPAEPTADGRERVQELAKFHLTVLQFYDWMYRHYRFLPPGDTFRDAMGRELSLAAVRARIEACHQAGMAALAYGAVYGAEPEFARQHPDWVLRDADGQSLSLIDLFYITDLRPGAPWREHILREFEAAVNELGFDGVHMDQYGFPKWCYDAEGKAVDLAESFPGLIDEAAARLAVRREGAAVLFNAVNDWPLEQVARTDQAAVYIEVWPPHDHYRDLVDLVRRARDLSRKQVVLAAYLEPFREGGEGAETAFLLATAVTASAGGFHLVLGEGDAVLRDPYYPNHGRLSPAFLATARRYYDHTAAHHHYLFAADLQDVGGSFTTGINGEFTLTGAPVATQPAPGAVWTTVRQRGGQFVVNLVNLTGLRDTEWNKAKERPACLTGLTLEFSRHFRVAQVTWSSPDDDRPTRELPLSRGRAGARALLPDLAVWATLVVEVE